jgi:glycosyltransferase involved in cell wall biosynthesis
VDELIRSFAVGGSGHLVIAGPSSDEGYHKKLVRLTNQLRSEENVTFTGMLSGLRKWGAYAAAEAFVLPSHQENFGMAIAEALACGKPVLISNKVNIWPEIVGDGCGFAEEDDPAGIQRLLERWNSTTQEARVAMGQRARSCFAQRFEINRAVDSFLEVLRNPPVAG